MRLLGHCGLLFACVSCVCLFAQDTAPTGIPATIAPPAVPATDVPATLAPPAPNPQDEQGPPLTPEEQRDQQIRQFDPLDKTDQNADGGKKDKDKTAGDARNQAQQKQTPTPGSLAAEAQDTARPAGPVVTEAEAGDEPVQQYTGPAVLSRSYSVNRPLIPQQLKWTETLGVNAVYESGAAEGINPDGSVSATALVGTQVNWSLAGRHYFGHDQIGVNYTGSLSEYSGANAFNGTNNQIAIDYTHVLTRRISLNLAVNGSILSQSYVLQNPELGPETTVANLNLGTSPNIQITDYGTKQFSSQADVTWQKTARLSFNGGTSYFAVVRDAPGLLGMTGIQARGDFDYRLTSRTTAGAYYSFSDYVYQKGFGTSNVSTVGAIYSYAFSRTMQLRVRAGVSSVNGLGFQVIQVAPSVAALLGQSSGIIDATTKATTTDISAQFIKDFRRGRTATIAFAHGVSPGNGIFMTSEQESISAGAAMPFRRVYLVQASFGRDTLTSVGFALGNYSSVYGRLGITRTFERGFNVNFGAEYRHFDITDSITVQNQLRITSGVTWGSTNGRLWPF